jgi:thymidylate kinase|tara:strand:+ start:293 stop:856 length:564 start_codon:yes stop_codon:yes gene_type:complete
MKILILEGIATSGKTTIKNKLEKYFDKKDLKYLVVEEDETLMPILHNTTKRLAIAHLKKVIEKALAQKKDILIFDRLYFTHIFRTKSSINDFKKIENLLKRSSLLIFLKIDKKKIGKRISDTMNKRPKWADYVCKKGNKKDIIKYYATQQELLLKLLKKSSVKHAIYNSTKNNFKNITKDIINKLDL